ncbi:MAG: hypothetical protein NT099_00490 [Candidatus Saganbacteria bacterium]|nr:hypothetical protein [Candidatus Saganbacteria bacterium]
MGVSPLVDQAGSQQMAVVGNQNVNIMQELDKVHKGQTQEHRSKGVESRSAIQKMIETGKATDMGMELLAELATKIAQSGVKLGPATFEKKATREMKDEYDLMFQSKEDVPDTAEIYYSIAQIGKKSGQQNKQKQEQEGQSLAADKETAALAKDYTATYAQYVVNGATELKRKLEDLELKLTEKGVSPKNILSFQLGVKTSMRREIAKQLRDAYLDKFLTPEKTMDQIMRTRNVDSLLDFVHVNERLGSWYFGGYNNSLQGTSDRSGQEALLEIRDFVREEIETGLTKKLLSENPKEIQKLDNDLKDLLKMANKLSVNLNQFSANWQQKKEDLGLNLIIPPPPNSLLAAGTQTNTNSGNQQKNGFEMNLEDEREVLVNRMRAIYLIRAFKGDVFTAIETAFKMRKLKNGLIKLGYSIGDLDKIKEQVKQEGEALARMKCFELLKEALRERATLHDLAGPAYKLIERKIKGVLSSLERLGVKLPKDDFNALRDHANEEMFDISMEELQDTSMALKAQPHPVLEMKQALLLKLLNRLKEESGINTPLPAVESVGQRV